MKITAENLKEISTAIKPSFVDRLEQAWWAEEKLGEPIKKFVGMREALQKAAAKRAEKLDGVTLHPNHNESVNIDDRLRAFHEGVVKGFKDESS